MRQLTEAIRTRDVETVRSLIAEDPGLLDEAAADGMTPLHFAVESGDAEIVSLLVEAGARLEARNRDGRTPLHDAVEYGMIEIQELLIDRGSKVDVNLAAILGKTDLLRGMLERDPSLANDRSTRLSPLGWAAFGNQVESARILIDTGARMDDGELLCAASVGHVEVGEYLIDRGIGVNDIHRDSGETALHAAVAMRYTDDSSSFVKMLLDRGADPSVRNADGMTPLELARELERRQNETSPAHRCRFDRVIELL